VVHPVLRSLRSEKVQEVLRPRQDFVAGVKRLDIFISWCSRWAGRRREIYLPSRVFTYQSRGFGHDAVTRSGFL
jgi:hypothetical protein